MIHRTFTPARSPAAILTAAALLLHSGWSVTLAGDPPPRNSAAPAGESIEVLRDPWGIPHIFADTDAGAFYGLGYATAEDRAFQMTYALRMAQGRLSEVLGEVRHTNRNETSLDHDRKMRTFGFYRAAKRTAANLDPETLGLLQAYSDGVNAWFRDHQDRLHPLFARTGLEPEPWTPADCLVSWWNLGQYFATDGTRELIARRNELRPGPDPAVRTAVRETGAIRETRPVREAVPPREAGPGRDTVRAVPAAAPAVELTPLPPDDAAAVVKRSDVPAEWIDRVLDYARERGVSAGGSGGEGPRFSHAWVVGGRRTTTGSSVLVSDPQTPVRNPSLFYTFHVRGATFNARGLGVAGSPGLLIGFTEQVAWGVTALGADQADLFLLDTDPARPDQYRFDGQWRPMTVHRESIRVKGRDPIPYTVRETRLGPVATAFCFALPDEGEVALKRIPLVETDRETIQGALAMMRARNADEFHRALDGWRFPSVNLLYGDRDGNIGYIALAALPIRSRLDPHHGRLALPGHRAEQDWQEIAPYDLLPQVRNPAAGFLHSGNHRPIESWYPLPLHGMTGAGGDTQRSRRLRERLEALPEFTPEQVLDIHFDAVNPARRDIVRLGLHLRDTLQRDLSEDALAALEHLEPWHRSGAVTSLDQPGAELALELNTFFRIASTDLAAVYGGGESGLAYFLKTVAGRLNQDPQADLSPLEQTFIEQSLAAAWQSARQKYGRDPAAWNLRARAAVAGRRLGYFEGLHGFPPLDPALAVASPALTRIDGGTIGCQTAQSYTQWVPLHDPDQALSILPIGQSEWPDHPSRTSTLELWGDGRLHPAPLSRAAVEALGVTVTRLTVRGPDS